ncbi:MAG: acyl-CoA thioesterase [Roseibium sp.]|uniref:acyl-CoA thioesterase n=1 Tax=Roseibium sp. TaxID=1936156 RepID=UPI001B141FC8|nr:thioesterase family protein [Roseibium sp.]MBO6890975.1 acyl-CoA thioesterase [Roseibium sp.]MBO6931885.1 acyl-CoA thioesterase [Roseibium sp.]
MISTNTPQPERPVPLDRDAFTTFREIPTRWMDVDIYGHVNNVQYLSFFDTAVNGWYIDKGILDPAHGSEVFLVVETGCHYFAELKFPDPVFAGIRIEKLGTSSVVFRIGLFSGEETRTAAHGKFVHVHVDRDSRRPSAISDQKRGILEGLLLR